MQRVSLVRRIGRGLVWALMIIVALGLLGLTYQAAATAIDGRRFPPPGERIAVGGHGLHMRCYGEGSPTLLFEAGAGGSSLDWGLVEPALQGLTRLCFYDRAGLGWSEPGPVPRTAERGARELYTLLDRAGEKGPFVIVAHSLGGLYARVFAGLYPEKVQGLVLVDPTDVDPIAPALRRGLSPAEVAVLEGAVKQGEAAMETYSQVLTWAGRLGLLRFLSLVGIGLDGEVAKLPPEQQPAYRAVTLRTTALVTAAREVQATPQSQAQAAQFSALGDIPLVVLRPAPAEPAADVVLPPGFTPELLAKMDQVDAPDPVLALSPRSRRLTVEQSGHYIQLDQPQAVVDAIREVLAAVRP